MPSRRTRLCLRGSTAIRDSFVVDGLVRGILQQVAERDQRVALPRGDPRSARAGTRRDAPPPPAHRPRRAGRRSRPGGRAPRHAAPARAGSTGRRLSGCTVQNTHGVSRRRSAPNMARLVLPHGGRKKRGGAPAAWVMAACPSPISRSVRSGPQRQRLVWLQVWLPRSWPASAMRRATAGACAARRPIRKKAPRTPSRSRMSSTRGVHVGIRPVVEGERDGPALPRRRATRWPG